VDKLLTAVLHAHGGLQNWAKATKISARMSLGGAFFFALAKRALRWEHIRYVQHFVVMSLLATAVYYLAFAKGKALLPSSIAGLLSGAIPLFTFICAWLFLSEEHINMTKAAGVALGFLGVLLIARPWSSSVAIDILGVTYIPPVVALVIGVFLAGDVIHPLG
jgi:drug/metabolite transporter (DMT)-like permease